MHTYVVFILFSSRSCLVLVLSFVSRLGLIAVSSQYLIYLVSISALSYLGLVPISRLASILEKDKCTFTLMSIDSFANVSVLTLFSPFKISYYTHTHRQHTPRHTDMHARTQTKANTNALII